MSDLVDKNGNAVPKKPLESPDDYTEYYMQNKDQWLLDIASMSKNELHRIVKTIILYPYEMKEAPFMSPKEFEVYMQTMALYTAKLVMDAEWMKIKQEEQSNKNKENL